MEKLKINGLSALTVRNPEQLRREKENLKNEQIGLKKSGFFSEKVTFQNQTITKEQKNEKAKKLQVVDVLADRTFGSNFDHRDFSCNVVASVGQGKEDRATLGLRKQSQADGAGLVFVYQR